MGLPWPLFVCLFHYFQANNTIFTTNIYKMSIQYTVLGVEPTVFR